MEKLTRRDETLVIAVEGRCGSGKSSLAEPIHVEFKNVTIIEGVYSLHPTLRHAYDYKIFLTVDPEV